MARAIPVPEVTDLGDATVPKLRAAGFDMGPGNPNVGPAGSAERAAFNAAATAPAPAAPASMRSRVAGVARAVGDAGVTPARVGLGLLPAAAGAVVGAQQRKSDLAATPEPFTPAPAKPGDIPSDPTMRGPAVIPERRPLGFGPNNEFTRNLANTLNALGPVGALPRSAALPVVAAAAGTPGRIREGLNVAGRAAGQFVAGANAGSAMVGESAAPAAAPSVTPQTFSDTRFDAANGTTPAAPSTNVVTRDGNNFSGNNVREGFNYNVAGRDMPAGQTVSSLNTIGVDGYMRQLANIRALAPTPGSDVAAGGGLSGLSGETLSSDLRRIAASQDLGPSIDERMTLRNARGADGRAAAALANQRSIAAEQQRTTRTGQQLNADTQRYSADLSATTSRANTAANNATSRENNTANVTATMRGQDITAGSNRARIAYDMAKDQRDYLAGRSDKDMEHRRQAEADHNKWAESVFTRQEGDKIVPDTAKVADFNNVAMKSLGNLITRLSQTGDPANIAKAEKLRSQGLAALDAEDRALMKTLYDRRDRFAQTRGAGPLSAGGAVSDDLFDYSISGRDNGVLQDRFKMRGGQSIPVNDLRYTEPANAVLPDWFKTPTTTLGPTMRERLESR